MSLETDHQADLAKVSGLAQAELALALAQVDEPTADGTKAALLAIVPAIGDRYADMAGALAADFYETAREAAAAPGRFSADLAPLPNSSRYEALVRWGVDPLYHPDAHDLTALSPQELTRDLVSGGLQRIVSNADRLTVVDNTLHDPAATGWVRNLEPGACKFCRMLHDRGGVYSEAAVTFSSHDHCKCSASPSWDAGRKVSVMAYTASKRNITDADRARVRAYLSEHYSDD